MGKDTINFLKELQEYEYTLSGNDHVWKILFKNHI